MERKQQREFTYLRIPLRKIQVVDTFWESLYVTRCENLRSL